MPKAIYGKSMWTSGWYYESADKKIYFNAPTRHALKVVLKQNYLSLRGCVREDH